MEFFKKHKVALLIGGGIALLYYLYRKLSGSSATAVDSTATYLAAMQAAQASSPGAVASGAAGGGTAAAPIGIVDVSGVLNKTPAATPGGAVVQPGTSGSGVPSNSNQTQEFAANTPAPPVRSIAALVASGTTPLTTAQITALPQQDMSLGVTVDAGGSVIPIASSPQSLGLTKGVFSGNADVIAIQQAYDAAYTKANPAAAAYYAASQNSPFLELQAQTQNPGGELPNTLPNAPINILPTVSQLFPNGIPAPVAPSPSGITPAQQLAILVSEGITPATTAGTTLPASPTPPGTGPVTIDRSGNIGTGGYTNTRPIVPRPPPAQTPPVRERPIRPLVGV